MAKRINLDVPGIRLNETMYRILRCIADTARAERFVACVPVRLSRRALAETVACSESNVIRSCQALESQNLLAVTANTNDKGGRLENSYTLTALGIEILRLAEDALARAI